MTYYDMFQWKYIRVLWLVVLSPPHFHESATPADWGSRPDPWECEALRDVARVAGQMGQLIQPQQRSSWSNHQVLKSCNSQMFCDFRTGSVVHGGWWHSNFRYIQLSVMLKPIIGFAPKHEPASIGFGGSLMVLVGKTHVQSFQL